MERQHEQKEQAEVRAPERDTGRVPRIYVASLSDYNAGRLVGSWLDAAHEYDDLMGGVQAMLAKSHEPHAEEWAIHDYEGFGDVRLGEYEPLSIVSEIARGIVEHGPAFAAWADFAGREPERLRQFEDAYRGDWGSLDDYVRELVDDLGIEDELDRAVSEGMRPYVQIDYEGLARDMELSGDIYIRVHEGGAYVFDATL